MLRGLSLLSIASGASAQSLKVFLMLGQSNMEGQGIVAIDGAPGVGNGTLEYLALNPPTSVPVVGVADAATERIGYAAEGADWKAVLDADGNFTSYPNVWSWGNEGQAHGALRPGMGVSEYRMGPEYGFGAYLAASDAFKDETILLLKVAYGGTTLGDDWRPPSSVAAAGGEVGWCYTNMTTIVPAVLANISALFPAYTAEAFPDGWEITGLGWDQGWNDGEDEAHVAEYAANLKNLVRDIRAEFDVPALPVSIPISGFGGWGQNIDRRLGIMAAQYNISVDPEFAGSAAAQETRGFFRDFDETGGALNQGYHWFGNCESYLYIGTVLAQGMLGLLDGSWKQPVINTSVPEQLLGAAAPPLSACGDCEW